MTLHLTGTDFFEAVEDDGLASAKDLWEQTLVSEIAPTSTAASSSRHACSSTPRRARAALTVEALADAAPRRPDARRGGARLRAGSPRRRLRARHPRRRRRARSSRSSSRFAPPPGSSASRPTRARSRALYWASLDAEARKVLHARGREPRSPARRDRASSAHRPRSPPSSRRRSPRARRSSASPPGVAISRCGLALPRRGARRGEGPLRRQRLGRQRVPRPHDVPRRERQPSRLRGRAARARRRTWPRGSSVALAYVDAFVGRRRAHRARAPVRARGRGDARHRSRRRA